jgi:replicative DNA helicase
MTDLHRGPRRRPKQEVSIDRLPPHSPEAEQGILGCILLSPNECAGECVEKLKAGAEVFYDLRHQMIFKELVGMYDQRESIDIITLQQRLKDKQVLDQVGGIAYLSQLPDLVPSAANLSFYLEIVREKFRLRKMVQLCTQTVANVYDFEGDADNLMENFEREALNLQHIDQVTEQVSMKDAVKAAIVTVEEYHMRQGGLIGLPTGFIDLDKMTGGLMNSEMFVLAGRPSTGKTSLAMNIAEFVAINQQLPVGVVSLETTTHNLVMRMLASLARVNMRNIREGFLAERDFPKLTGAAGKLSTAPIFIEDISGISIMEMRARARRLQQAHGIRLLIIDYLQLLIALINGRRPENRQREVAEISSGIKALAKELKIPVIAISQLNRQLDRDKQRKPMLADLRESGSLEQDADMVGMLYRCKRQLDEDEEDEDGEVIPVNLRIAKQKNGPCGDVPLTFLKAYTRFESAAKVADEDEPQRKMPYAE